MKIPSRVPNALLILSLLYGCSSPRPPERPAAAGIPAPSPALITPKVTVRNLKIRLQVSTPSDLKVKEGQSLTAGAILARQTAEIERLNQQRTRLKKMIAQVERPRPTRFIPPMPDVSYQSEAATIQKARAKVSEIKATITRQSQRLTEIESLPPELSAVVKAHEIAKLQTLNDSLRLAELDLDLAKGALAQAKNRRADAEYLHALKIQEAKDADNQANQRQQDSLAQLTYQLNLVEYSLAQVAAVHSPWNGKIQRIRWMDQNGNQLAVELTLAVSDPISTGTDSSPLPPSNPSVRGDDLRIGLPDEPQSPEPEPPPLFGL